MCNLSLLRSAVDSYWTQHDGFPGPDAASVQAQLAGRTTRSGQPAAADDDEARGPYLRSGEIPVNPVTGGNRLTVVESMPNAPDGGSDWIYCPQSGEVRANTPGASPEGLPWFGL